MDKFIIRKSSSTTTSVTSNNTSIKSNDKTTKISTNNTSHIKSSSSSSSSSSSNNNNNSKSNSVNTAIDIEAIFTSFLNSNKNNISNISKKNNNNSSKGSGPSKAHSSSHKTITKSTISNNNKGSNNTVKSNPVTTATTYNTSMIMSTDNNVDISNQENQYADTNIVYIDTADDASDNIEIDIDDYNNHITMNTSTYTDLPIDTGSANVTITDTNVDLASSSIVSYRCSNSLTGGNRAYSCVPFSFDPRRVNHPLYSTNMCYSFTQGLLSAKNLNKSQLRFGHDANARNENSGVSAIKFDHYNTYFAASCCSNGIVNIYYFQECLTSLLNRNKDTIMSDITLDTRRAISDISWSISNPNELVIAFSFQSLLHVYNLEEPEQPTRVLETGKGSSSGGGYKVTTYINKNVSKNGTNVKKEMIIAGSSYGYIRMWDGRNDTRPVWDFQADPQAAIKGSAVVSIIPIADMTNLLSVTEAGIISIWDLNNFTVTAFMSEAKPVCIKKMCLWQDILKGKNYNVCGVLSVSLPYKDDTNIISITLKNNVILFVNITNGSLSSLWNPSLLAKTNKISIISKDNQSEQVEVNTDLSAHQCNTIYPSWGRSRYSIRGIHGTKILRITDHTPLYDSIDSLRGQRNRNKFDTYLTQNDNGTVSSNFYKSDNVCMTLPGNIVAAEKGSNMIMVSKDVKAFLTGNNGSSNTVSLSSTIYFDWSTIEIYDTKSKKDYYKKGSHNTVSCLNGLQLILEDPYWGPDVTNGSPKVYMRTNLVPGTNASANVNMAQKLNDVIDHVVHEPITCLAAHSELPYIIAGDKSGNVFVFGPDHRDHPDESLHQYTL